MAPTRGGKGLLATSQLLTWPHSVVVNDIKGELFTQTAVYRQTLGPVFVLDARAVGHRYDPLLGKHTEDELFSVATHLLFTPNEGDGVIFTQRATVMLAQLLLAARAEGQPPLPYVRHSIRAGLATAAERLYTVQPELATQFLVSGDYPGRAGSQAAARGPAPAARRGSAGSPTSPTRGSPRSTSGAAEKARQTTANGCGSRGGSIGVTGRGPVPWRNSRRCSRS